MGNIVKKLIGIIIALILIVLGVYSYVAWGAGPLVTVIKGVLGIVLILIGLLVGIIMWSE